MSQTRDNIKLGGPGKTVKVTVNIPQNKEEGQKKNTYAYITIDTSGSMCGSKLSQVISSLREIIGRGPKHARFVIRSFSNEVRTLVSKQKQYLDLNRLERDLKDQVGGMTALYDASAQTIREIDHKSLSTDRVYILIFTDGQDNVSTKETLDSAINLVNDKMANNVFFTFIQAGQTSPAVKAIQQKCSHKNCKVMSIEDSAEGIRVAFEKVRKQMMLHFEVSLDGDGHPLLQGLNGLKIQAANTSIAVNTIGADSNSNKYRNNNNSNNSVRAASSSSGGPWRNTNNTTTSSSSSSFNGRKPSNSGTNTNQSSDATRPSSKHGKNPGSSRVTKEPSTHNQNAHPIRSNNANTANTGQPKSTSQSQQGGSSERKFDIVIRNIPLSSKPQDVVAIFSRWGFCTLADNGIETSTQWTILSYSNVNDMSDALIHGDDLNLHGNRLYVCAK